MNTVTLDHISLIECLDPDALSGFFLSMIRIMLLSLALASCASTPVAVTTTDNISGQQPIEQVAKALYLLGNFNLWDHNRQYKLIKVSHNTYAASAVLNQNQRYEFMFAAKDSTKSHSNCGYLKQQTIRLDQKVVAQCNNVVLENFVFTPEKSAVYEFFLELNTLNRPLVYVQKAY